MLYLYLKLIPQQNFYESVSKKHRQGCFLEFL